MKIILLDLLFGEQSGDYCIGQSQTPLSLDLDFPSGDTAGVDFATHLFEGQPAVKGFHGGRNTVLLPHLLCQYCSSPSRVGGQGELQGLGEPFDGHLHLRDRPGSGPSGCYHVGPERLAVQQQNSRSAKGKQASVSARRNPEKSVLKDLRGMIILSKKWYDNSGTTIAQTAGCSAGTSVMHHG